MAKKNFQLGCISELKPGEKTPLYGMYACMYMHVQTYVCPYVCACKMYVCTHSGDGDPL